MRTILITVFTIAFVTTTKAQNITKNNVYFEIGGASLFYSMNYERLMFKSDKNNISVRIGIMYLNFFNDTERTMSGVPIGVSYLKKIRKKYLEVGLSGSMIYDSYYLNSNVEEPHHIQDLVLMPSIRAGIRHQPKVGGLFWNALLQYSVTAVDNINNFNNSEINSFPMVSFGVGYTF